MHHAVACALALAHHVHIPHALAYSRTHTTLTTHQRNHTKSRCLAPPHNQPNNKNTTNSGGNSANFTAELTRLRGTIGQRSGARAAAVSQLEATMTATRGRRAERAEGGVFCGHCSVPVAFDTLREVYWDAIELYLQDSHDPARRVRAPGSGCYAQRPTPTLHRRDWRCIPRVCRREG